MDNQPKMKICPMLPPLMTRISQFAQPTITYLPCVKDGCQLWTGSNCGMMVSQVPAKAEAKAPVQVTPP